MDIKGLIIIFLLEAFVFACKAQNAPIKQTAANKQLSFKNPLLPSGPDPWVIRKDGIYYYMNTGGSQIEIYKTKTLSQLSQAERKVVYRTPASGPDSHNIWAPELHFLNNKWYLYYTAGSTADLSTQRLFVLENSSEDPLKGTWVNKGQLMDEQADYFAIDATVFSRKGSNYVVYSGHISKTDNTQRLYISRLAEPWKMGTARVEISAPTYDWEKIGLPHVNEGPEILVNKKGAVFLIYSASGCWTDDYSLGMLSLKENGDPLNPAGWQKSPMPVFTKSAKGHAYGPGHNAFFKSPDGTQDWIIYHANSSPDQKCSNERNPRMQKFTWKADGTPNFGRPVAIDTYIQNPSGE